MKLKTIVVTNYALFLCCLAAAVASVAAILTDGAGKGATAADVAVLTATAGLIILVLRTLKLEQRIERLERRAGIKDSRPHRDGPADSR